MGVSSRHGMGCCDPQFVKRSPSPFKGGEGARALTYFQDCAAKGEKTADFHLNEMWGAKHTPPLESLLAFQSTSFFLEVL